ncbi:MAG: methylated-DNA--[protein]-cysteine S-methyltransferase [Pseudomonadota bacterium]|jgi:methylated-DNA-[protein]-cysteine S-methyltransferase|nr:MAG: cysteine methyltransferase [Pseudomonadota bacterium]
MYHYAIFRTDAGFCGIAWSDRGIVRFQLPTEEAAVTERLLKKQLPDACPGEPPPAVVEAMAAAHAYFAGQATDFSGCVIDLSGCDTFARRVYAFARRVGWGRTTTYGALAREAGAGPEAARDVGRAMATNPVPLIIPCHRVLAAGGKPGGFSGPGGVATKMRMLALEGIELAPQQSFAFEYPRSSL